MAKKDSVSKDKQTVEKKLVTPLDGPYLQYQNKRLLDFSSEDFLGLSKHPDVKKSAIKYTLRLGVGTLSHTFESLPQKQVEEKLANLLGFEKAFFFHSFSEAFSFLLTSESVVFSDQPLHISQATHTFSSLEQLKTLLSKTKLPPNVIHIILISSPSFDLKTLHSLAKEARAVLCFNDKEHFGIAGKRGLGFGAQQKEVDCVIGSFEHASGAPIAYIATSDAIFKEKPYVHPLIPSSLGALDAILNILPEMDAERAQMEKHIGWLQAQLREKGFSVPLTKAPKITLAFSREEAAERFLSFFIENDVMLGHLEPKQLSFSLTTLHTPDDLDQLSTVLKKLSDTDFALSTQSSTPTP